MSFVPDDNDDKVPVTLGIKEKNLYLSCMIKDDKPTLQLEVSECQWLKAPLAITDFLDNHLHLPENLTILQTCK